MSITQEKYGFVYIWFDKRDNRYYVGCHWGFENDGYICSSTWMRNTYRRRPNDFKRRIIKRVYTSRQDLFAEEQRYLDMIKPEEVRVRYFNLHITAGHWSSDPDKLLTVGQKISIKTKGISRNKGKVVSEETKQKIRDSLKGRKVSEESLEKRKGRKLSDEHKRKISEKLKIVNLSEEVRNKKSEDGKGRKLSDDHKKALLESRLGTKHTEESKKKMSVSLKGKIPWNKGMNL